MGKFENLLVLTTFWGVLASGLGAYPESDLIASMREIQLPSLDAQDFYAAHSPTHSRFRGPRAVKFEDDSGQNKKSSEAVSASFTVGSNGLSGSVSAAQADDGKTKGYFGAYPVVAGGYYPQQVPPPGYGGGGFYPQGFGGGGFGPHHHSSSSSAAAASSSSGGKPAFPIIGGPVSHSGSAASAGGEGLGGGFYPGGIGGGYYPGGGVGLGGYYPGQGYYPTGGYGYPGGGGGYGGGIGPNYLAPVGVGGPGLYGGGYYPPTGGFYGGGPGFPGYGGGNYGYGGFRKGEGDDKIKANIGNNNEDSLSKNFNSGADRKPMGSGVVFKDN